MTEDILSVSQFPEVRVVEASAGSGKTYCLARRYVQLLLLSSALAPTLMRSILAVTFTNKAAFEMKARILDFLKRIALGVMPAPEFASICAPLGLSPDEAARRAFRLMDEVIRHYHFFQVQTIDAFINAVLSGCAFKIGLSANFRIRRNYPDYLAYGLDQMIGRAGDNQGDARIFKEFLHQYLFLENKSGWFPKKDMLGLLKALYEQRNTYGMDFAASPVTTEEMSRRKRKIIEDLRELQEGLTDGADLRFVKSLAQFLDRYDYGFDVDKLSDYLAREEIPFKKNADVPPPLERLWHRIHGQIRQLCEEEAYGLFNPYIQVFNGIMGDVQALAAREDVLFLSDLNRRARCLFDEGQVTVEEVYYRLATRFQHYLMDEFQDTSLLQWANLEMMVEEALAGGGTLFYVGDKKQAIYGFRGGEARLFDYVQQRFAVFPVRPERLLNNYRSQKTIVEFNNLIFSTENLRSFLRRKEESEAERGKKDGEPLTDADWAGLDNVFGHAGQQALPSKTGGYVRVIRLPDRKKEESDDFLRHEVVALLRGLRQRFLWRDIAVLTRDNSGVEQMTSWLIGEGIPVESERTLNIRENPLVRELAAFLRFLNSPIDNRAFAEFLLGGLFTKTSGIAPDILRDFLFSLRDRISGQNEFYVYKEFRDCFPGAWDQFIDEFFRNVGLYPLYELTVSIVHRLAVFDHFPHQQGFIMCFLEVIRKYEEESTDIASFLEAFESLESEELYVHAAQSEAVRVMTVHKAKGLEFPVVILPCLSMEVQAASGGRMGQQAYVTRVEEGRLRLLRIKKKYLAYSEPLSEIHHHEYVRSLLSELNNVYVALTRPAEEMYIYIPARSGSAFNLANLLIPENIVERGSPQAQSSRDERPGVNPLPSPRPHDWIGFLSEEFVDREGLSRRAQRRRGERLHAILAGVGNLDGAEPARVVDAAVAAARQDDDEGGWEDLRAVVLDLVLSKDLREFFFVSGGEIFTEMEIVNPFGQTRRLDRVVTSGGQVIIVDYKSSRRETGDHQAQVREYLRLAGAVYPGTTVRGFLVYLDDGAVEAVPAAGGAGQEGGGSPA